MPPPLRASTKGQQASPKGQQASPKGQRASTKGQRVPSVRCQCDPTCQNPPLPDSPFCSKHRTTCSHSAPLSGSEPNYEPDKYNRYRGVKESHNCYTYAFNYLNLPKNGKCTKQSCPLPFPQPGRASGYPKWSDVKGKRCPDLLARIIGDVPGSTLINFEGKCPAGQRKIALVADEDEDYHFYRQDSDGYWSHKPGATDVIRTDATERPIYNPELASRHYTRSGLNYDQFCSYMCIPATENHRLKRGGTRTRTQTKTRTRTKTRTQTQTRKGKKSKRLEGEKGKKGKKGKINKTKKEHRLSNLLI